MFTASPSTLTFSNPHSPNGNDLIKVWSSAKHSPVHPSVGRERPPSVTHPCCPRRKNPVSSQSETQSRTGGSRGATRPPGSLGTRAPLTAFRPGGRKFSYLHHHTFKRVNAAFYNPQASAKDRSKHIYQYLFPLEVTIMNLLICSFKNV